MSKVLKCGDIVAGCDRVIRGNTEEEVLGRAAEHAKNDHGMETIPEGVLTSVKAAIHEE